MMVNEEESVSRFPVTLTSSSSQQYLELSLEKWYPLVIVLLRHKSW